MSTCILQTRVTNLIVERIPTKKAPSFFSKLLTHFTDHREVMNSRGIEAYREDTHRDWLLIK